MLNLKELRQAISMMKRDDALYLLLKEELTRLDHWKAKSRGNMNGIKSLKLKANDHKRIKKVHQAESQGYNINAEHTDQPYLAE